MSAFLLDTDTLTLAQFGHATVIANLAKHPVVDVSLPVIAVQEQMRGWLGRLAQLTDPQRIEDWYDRLVVRFLPAWRAYRILSFPQNAQTRFEQLRSMKLNVGLMDLRIAAIALEVGLVVVTRNQRDFGRVPGLTIVDWTL